MKNLAQTQIEVHAYWGEPQLVGILYASISRGKEIFSFEYSENWLNSDQAILIDPALQLFRGMQYAPQSHDNFAVFLDSAPDRWGRVLMDRREAQIAREENRKEYKLLESDYLLGDYDQHRMGALRFKINSEGPFLDNNKEKVSPPWTSLRELEYASLELEKNDAENNPNYSQWLNMLIAPGSSLGGARPKASVIDQQGHLWIAKFPSINDEYDIGAWEMLALKLARAAKIQTADADLRKFNVRNHTFLNKRFDRKENNQRIHFASAMTLLQRQDGDDGSKGVSYLELAQFITQLGAQVEQDLEELWRRIVFFICISNVDDHLRNHGFLLQQDGWVLAPAYDINPVASGNGLKLNISETDNSQDLSLALDVAEYFRLKSDKANKIIREVIKVVKTWRQQAKALGISAREQDRMARAFRVADVTCE